MDSITNTKPSQPEVAHLGVKLYKDGRIELTNTGDTSALLHFLGQAIANMNSQIAA